MRAIVALSGGMDSATVLAECLQRHPSTELLAVSFAYGSKHGVYERIMAVELAGYYSVKHRILDLTGAMSCFRSDLLKTGGPVPEGHYAEESMRRTIVPFRNGIFLSLLAGVAGSEEANEIWCGVHAGDHFIYPDCRPQFVSDMRHAIQSGLGREVSLIAPFLYVTKVEILWRGLELDVPYRLTRTCYQDQLVACGKCGSCQERLAAWQAIGLADPLEYASREILPRT